MSPNSGSPGSQNDKTGPRSAGPNAKRDAAPESRQTKPTARLLAGHQPLIDHLYAEAAQYSWSLSRERFESALERSAAKRFASQSVSPDQIEEYLGALHLQDLALAAACAEGHAE